MAEAPSWLPPRWLPAVTPMMNADGTRHFADCSYVIENGYRPVELDAWVPASDVPVPVVVWVHGGGYAQGDRRRTPDPVRFARLFPSVVEAGIALVSIDYRLGREAVFPGAVHDAKAALRWLARYADTLGIDPTRVAMWGESAGGHLAGFTTATHGQGSWDGEQGVRAGGVELRAFVSWYGAMDLPTIVRPSITPEIEAAFGGNVPEFIKFPPEYFNLGAERWQDPQVRATASPSTHATAAMPPTLFVHGDADRMVPIQQSELMHARLQELGVPSELVRIPGADHVWMGVDQATVDDIIGRSVAFLSHHLLP